MNSFTFIHLRRLWILALALAIALVSGALGFAAPAARADASTGSGGLFSPVVTRLFDSGNGTGGAPSTPLTRLTWYQVQVDGVGGIPSAGVSAIAVSFVVSNPTQTGSVRADKSGVSSPNTSVTYASFSPGTGMTNTAVLPVGSNGEIQVQVTGATDLRIDTQGYYSAGSTAAGGYVPVAATNMASTLDGSGGFPQATVSNGSTVTFAAGGAGPIPSNASSVVLSIAESSSSSGDGWLVAYPAGTSRPISALHWPSAKNYEFTTTVKLPTSGQISVTVGAGGPVNLQVAVQGYFTQESGSSQAGLFTPGAARVYDSRTSDGQVAAGVVRKVQVTGVNGVPAISTGITSVAVNLQVVAPVGSQGHIQAFADDQTSGPAAQQFYANTTTSGFVIVPVGADGGIDLQTSSGGSVDVVVDVEGWYSGPATASIACPAPYSDGSWSAVIPSDTITCTVTVPQSDDAGANVQSSVDGFQSDPTPLNLTDVTTTQVTIPAQGGSHALEAITTSSDGATHTTDYTVGFGNWAAAALAPVPEDGGTAYANDSLSATSATDQFSPDTLIQYTLSASPDGSSNPIAVSNWTTVPFDTTGLGLTAGTTYYWKATVKGTSGGSQAISTVQSPVWSFVQTADNAPYVDADATTNPQAKTAATATDNGGPRGSYLLCNKLYLYTGPGGTTSIDHVCGALTTRWGFQMSATVCGLVVGAAPEHGMIWAYNGKTMPKMAAHADACHYILHGTFNPGLDDNHFGYSDLINFKTKNGGGNIPFWGAFTMTSSRCTSKTSC